MYAHFLKNDPLSIRFVGSGKEFKEFINNLVVDFQEPTFGYNGEQFEDYE